MKKDIKILLVDDEAEDRKAFRGRLKKIGYSQIEEARDAPSAIKMARDCKPDLILMDTQMPWMLGYVACEQIRQEDFGKDIAIIGMSSGSYRKNWSKAGADDFFYKDVFFDAFVLERRIQRALERYSKE